MIDQYLMFDDKFESMPWSQIDNVIFDIGNVLFHFSDKKILSLISDVTLHDRLQRVLDSPYWIMLDHGTLSEEEAILAMGKADPDLKPCIRYILDHWIEVGKPIDQGIYTLQACKRKHKRLFVLSNFSTKFHILEAMYPDIFADFDSIVISSDVELLKPNPDIFKFVIDKFSLDPSRTLYLDDNRFHIESARSCGLECIFVDHYEKLLTFFRE